MAADMFMRVGDLAPSYRTTLTTTGGQDLSGAASPVFIMRNAATKVVKVSADATLVSHSATEAVVQYDWVSGDTDTPGVWEIEVQLTVGGKLESFPNAGYDLLWIN